MNYQWISLTELYKDIKINPNKYTAWFRYILNYFEKEQFEKRSMDII